MSEKDRIYTTKIIKVLMKGINNSLDRHDKIRDPMTRNILLLDKMCSGMDMIGALAEVMPKEEGFDREFCEEVKTTSERMKKVVGSLFEWVQNPTYDSNHPVGREMMRQGQENLDRGGVRSLDE